MPERGSRSASAYMTPLGTGRGSLLLPIYPFFLADAGGQAGIEGDVVIVAGAGRALFGAEFGLELDANFFKKQVGARVPKAVIVPEGDAADRGHSSARGRVVAFEHVVERGFEQFEVFFAEAGLLG